MIDTAFLALVPLAAAVWRIRGEWRAQPAASGALAVMTRVATGRSTRITVALACAVGLIAASWLAARLIELTAAFASATGLDAAAWAPAGADVVVLAVIAAALLDVVVLGLCRVNPHRLAAVLRKLRLPELLTPALRHSIYGLLLPAVVVAGGPLLVQTGVDARDALSGVQAPAACAPADVAGSVAGDTVAGYRPDRLANAAVIVQVGREMGVPERGQWIALATAMQESGLRNLDYGDRDSLGLFQQRPSQGWGSRSQVTDPAYAAGTFYAHLLKIPGWADRPLWQAAQAVQRSGFPTAYAKHERDAAAVLGAINDTTCPAGRS